MRGLTKRYGPRTILEGVSFQVGRGEVFALLGPNGAGKTTTIEILEGYRNRDNGEVAVLGLDPARSARAIRSRIGLMLQEGGVYPSARPREVLALFAAYYPNPDDPDRLMKLVGLEESHRTTYRRLSGGQKQRLSLALALIGRPELVFLDEPTAGLDPRARRETWEIVRELRRSGVTVLLTTHFLDEAEALADQVAILDRGHIIAGGTPADLRASDNRTVRLSVAGAVAEAEIAALPSVLACVAERPSVYRLTTEDAPRVLAVLTAWAADRGIGIRSLQVGEGSLEDVYLRLTGDLPTE